MHRRYDYRRHRNSNALWGVLITAVVAVMALVFLVNTTGNNAVTASKNIPADTATTGSAAPPPPAPSTTGQSTPQ
jgi:hypothetical protein